MVMGLGEWAGRQQWPLPWLHTSPTVKVLGFTFAADWEVAVAATWARVVGGMEATLNCWAARLLPTLQQRVQVLETFVLSRAWYFCQVFPLPAEWAARLRKAVAAFLWRGRTERLAMDELHRPRHQGGLGLSCVQSRAEALLTKQFLRFAAGGGPLTAHLSFWMGPQLRLRVPSLPLVPQAPSLPLPSFFQQLLPLLLEALALPAVAAADLGAVTSKGLYTQWTADLPYPKVEYKRPELPWHLIWPRLETLPLLDKDFFFSLLHNILPLPDRLRRLGMEPFAQCDSCGDPLADVLHCFVRCPRVAASWAFLLHRISRVVPFLLGDDDVLFLAWPPSPVEDALLSAVSSYVVWVWESRLDPTPLDPAALAVVGREAAASAAAAGRPFRHIFL
jgi:hypothetical protein